MAAPVQSRPTRRGRRGLAVGLGAALVAGGALVAVDVARAPASQAATLTPFGSCDELTAWYRDSALRTVTAYGDGGAVAFGATEEAAGGADSLAADSAAPQPAQARTGEAVGSGDTGTNVQEAGVDEPSRIKLADGRAYTLSGDRLLVVDLAAGTVLGELDLGATEEQWFSELLLVDDRVVVLGSASLPVEPGGPGTAPGSGTTGDLRIAPDVWPGWTASTTTATTVDVSDPAAPALVDRVELEGDYVSARASGGAVRLVTTTRPVLPFVDPWLLQQGSATVDPGSAEESSAPPFDEQAQRGLEARALEANQQVVRDADAAAWLPELVERDGAGAVTGRTPVDCASVAHPGEEAGTGTVSVLTLDPAAPDTLRGTTSVSADGSLVYASTDRLYVATTTGGWTWGGRGGGDLRTELHGFDTTDPTRTTWTGSGSVDGWLLGSWALDAADGHLRVGTTSRPPSADVGPAEGLAGTDAVSLPAPVPSGDTSSSVVVLRETADGLVETGRVDSLGVGEQIRSIRFFDDLAVVVTFRQTDPLYTVDLADPAAPRLIGELKVNGYSGYLHPVGDGLLVGVGQDGDADGVLSGAKVESYDLRDLAAPTALDVVAWPQSSSSAEWDSRLFAYLPGRRTAVLPLERYDADTYSSGLVAVGVGTDGALTETGSWQVGQGGWLGALASTEDVVVVSAESWTTTDDGELVQPRNLLTVLSPDGLQVLAEVELG